jgi:hypothetical protein
MARPMRIEYPGAVYHIICRGNNRQAIFRDDADRKRWRKERKGSSPLFAVLQCFFNPPNLLHKLLLFAHSPVLLEENLESNLLLTVKRETSLKVRQSEFRRGQDASKLGGLGEWSTDCERARGTAEFYKPRHALWLRGMDDEDR